MKSIQLRAANPVAAFVDLIADSVLWAPDVMSPKIPLSGRSLEGIPLILSNCSNSLMAVWRSVRYLPSSARRAKLTSQNNVVRNSRALEAC